MTRRAFTVVELIVVVGIIVLLVGLTVTVGVNVVEKAEVRKTQNVIQVLDMALNEWEATADRKLTWGEDGVPAGAAYDIQNTWPHVLVLPAVLDSLTRNSNVKNIISKIDADHLYRFESSETAPQWIDVTAGDPDPNANDAASIYSQGAFDNGRVLWGMVAVLDVWDEPLRVIHPGPVAGIGVASEPDGTVFVDDTFESEHELRYGAAVSRQVCFVSAGPDGKFGDVSAAVDTESYKQSLDNIYSYEVVRP